MLLIWETRERCTPSGINHVVASAAMPTKPFNTMPAILLSLPGLLLFLVAVLALLVLTTGVATTNGTLVSDLTVLIVFTGFLLTLVTLITTPIALFYTLSRSGNGPRRAGIAVVNALMLITAIASLIGFGMAMSVLLFNPG